jgi:hypothetical protein
MVGVCEGETVLLFVGEEKSGVREGVKVNVGKTNVSRGVGNLKKGLSGSLGLIRPVGPFSQNGKAWPRPGMANKNSPTMKRNFISWHSTGTHYFRLLELSKVYVHVPYGAS